jgi:hypothetical protein
MANIELKSPRISKEYIRGIGSDDIYDLIKSDNRLSTF